MELISGTTLTTVAADLQSAARKSAYHRCLGDWVQPGLLHSGGAQMQK